MADTITLVLNGDVTLEDFATAIARFWGVVEGLSRTVAEGQKIEWQMDRLEIGSTVVGVRGYGPSFAVRRVIQEYERIGQALQVGDLIAVPVTIRREVAELVDVIDNRVDSIMLLTDNVDAIVTHAAKAAAADNRPMARRPTGPTTAYGAVEGRVQTLSSRNEYRFTLYDSIFDKGVQCFLSPRDEDTMRDAWGRYAVIEGIVTRDGETGRPLTVRQIHKVTLLPEREPGAWRLARGASPGRPGVLPEDAIRAARDAE